MNYFAEISVEMNVQIVIRFVFSSKWNVISETSPHSEIFEKTYFMSVFWGGLFRCLLVYINHQ